MQPLKPLLRKVKLSLLFNVALFLRDEISLSYSLIPSDISILLLLASHIGERDYWYITRPQIAKECRLKESQFTRRLKNLENQKLIKVIRTGKANGYGITLPQIKGKPWSDDKYSSTYLKEDDRYSSTHQIGTVVPNRKVLEYPHKETINKLNKTERERMKRASPLSDVFLPNEENILLAQDLRVNLDIELESFMQRHAGKKTQYEFSRWLKQAKQYQTSYSAKNNTPPQLTDWTMERIKKQEAEERERQRKEREEMEATKPVIEYVPFKEMVRRHKEKQGELNEKTNTNTASDNRSRRKFSDKS